MAEEIKNENQENTGKKSILSEVEGIDGITNFFKKYQNFFYIGIIAILLGVIAYTFLGKKSNPTKELQADAQTLQMIESYTNPQSPKKDSADLVLNGFENNAGLLSIIKKNPETVAANMARLQAAVAYLKTDRPKDALKMLESAKGFGPQVNAKRMFLIGDAKSEMATEKEPTNTKLADEAIDAYEDAANTLPGDVLSANYLLRAAYLQEKIGKMDAAKKTLLKIKDKYPESIPVKNGEVEKSLAKLGVEN
jgi:predicted negative regulator of RcsB-dependent stress response